MAEFPHELNLRHLQAVSTIAREGGVNRAAELLGLSQPALTQGLAKLERQIGWKLFERSGTGMSQTEAGRTFATRIDRAFLHLQKGLSGRATDAPGDCRVNRFTMSQITGFLAFARAGSFAGAAGMAGRAQPSIHRAARGLEGVWERPLIERRGRGAALTRQGRIAARHCGLFCGEIEAGLAELGALAGRVGGRIAIGTMPLARAGLVPQAIARFREQHPHVVFDIVDGPYGELIEALRDGDVDMLVGALRNPAPGSDVTQEALFEDRLAVVCRSGHPLAGSDPGPAELYRFPWIIARPDTPMHEQWRRLFDKLGQAVPEHPIYCGSVNAIRVLLSESDCLTLLSPHQIRRDLAFDQLTVLIGPIEETARPIGLTLRADWQPTASAREFIALLRELADAGLAQNQ